MQEKEMPKAQAVSVGNKCVIRLSLYTDLPWLYELDIFVLPDAMQVFKPIL